MRLTTKRLIALCATMAVVMMTANVNAGFISGVTKANGNDSCGTGGCPELDFVVLSDTELLRNDRTHTLTDIPSELVEDNATQPLEMAEMIQLSNSDKGSADLTVDVTLSRLSVLYIGIDNRQFSGAGGTTVQTTQYPWMSDTSFTGLPSPFVSTNELIGVDENGDGSTNQFFTLFAAIAPAGTYTLGAHTGGGNNMYVVLADDHLLFAVPEPSALPILGLGLLGMTCLRRRRK